MNAVRFHETLKKDGELLLKGLPYRQGQKIELIVLSEFETKHESPLTADKLRCSELIGLWKDRPNLGNSAEYARQLREQAQRRKR